MSVDGARFGGGSSGAGWSGGEHGHGENGYLTGARSPAIFLALWRVLGVDGKAVRAPEEPENRALTGGVGDGIIPSRVGKTQRDP
jgi:hypothetical protein